MSMQDLERRVNELEDSYKDIQEKHHTLHVMLLKYENMTNGVKWVFVILSGLAAFIASVKAVFGKLISL